MKTAYERMEEIIEEIRDLNNEAYDIVRKNLTQFNAERARAYWHATIETAIDGAIFGNCDMRESLEKLSEEEEEEEEEE